MRKRKQDDRWGRDGGKGGEGHEREIEGNRQRERVTWNFHSVGKTELFMENQFCSKVMVWKARNNYFRVRLMGLGQDSL